MVRRYFGFYVSEETKRTGFCKKEKKDVYGPLRIEADTFAEAQQRCCNNMEKHDIKIAFIFPYWEDFEK